MIETGSHCGNSVSIQPHFDVLCDDEKYTCKHFDVTLEYQNTKELRIIAWINWVIAFVITLAAVIYIYTIWMKEKNKIEGWPWQKKIYGINLSRFKCMSKQLMGFGLVCKLVPSLTMDVLDILTDTLYFDQITKRCGVLDTRLNTPQFVYHVLFAFMVLGMLKNIVVSNVAYRQLTKRLQMDDMSESDLVDNNAYMAITFFQGVLAFVFQDSVAALIQFFYIDKYVTTYNLTAIFNGVIMLLFAVRVLYVFSRYIYQYWDKLDPIKVKALHVIMLSTKISVCMFHLMRTYAVVFNPLLRKVLTENPLDPSCFSTSVHHGIKTTTQNPFAMDCLVTIDKMLLFFTALASIGVVICTVLVCFVGFEHFKIFNQSHYSGRIGNITGMSQKMPTIAAPQLAQREFDPTIARATDLGSVKK